MCTGPQRERSGKAGNGPTKVPRPHFCSCQQPALEATDQIAIVFVGQYGLLNILTRSYRNVENSASDPVQTPQTRLLLRSYC